MHGPAVDPAPTWTHLKKGAKSGGSTPAFSYQIEFERLHIQSGSAFCRPVETWDCNNLTETRSQNDVAGKHSGPPPPWATQGRVKRCRNQFGATCHKNLQYNIQCGVMKVQQLLYPLRTTQTQTLRHKDRGFITPRLFILMLLWGLRLKRRNKLLKQPDDDQSSVFLTRTLGQLGVSAHVEHLLCCQIRTILSSTYNKQRQIWVLHIRTGSSQADQIKTPPSSLGGHPLNHNTNIHTYTTFNMRYSDFKTCNHV